MNINSLDVNTISLIANLFSIIVPIILVIWFFLNRYQSNFEDILLNDLIGKYGKLDVSIKTDPNNTDGFGGFEVEKIGYCMFITHSNKNGYFFGYIEENVIKFKDQKKTSHVRSSVSMFYGKLKYSFFVDFLLLKMCNFIKLNFNANSLISLTISIINTHNGQGDYTLGNQNALAEFKGKLNRIIGRIELFKISEKKLEGSTNDRYPLSYDFYKSFNLPFEHFDSASRIKEFVVNEYRNFGSKP